ncbi:MAG: transglutaminase-like domain-containing protein [Candidatus Thermoplasmatota archaeon]
MLRYLKIFVISVLLSIQLISGCLFFKSASFTLLSYEIIDNEGFPSMKLVFNVSAPATIIIKDPSNQSILSEVYTPGLQTTILPIGLFRSNPESGFYRILVLDDQTGDTIDEEVLSFKGSDILITDASFYWLEDKEGYSLLRVNLSIMNNGDMIVYPNILKLIIDNRTITAYSTPSAVSPGERTYVNFFMYIDHLDYEEYEVALSLLGTDHDTLSTKSMKSVPIDNTGTIKYTWIYKNKDYHMELPDPDYLYTYYSNLPRPATLDYAAYIFDKYDDDYLLYLKEQIDGITIGLNNDENKRNLLAAFVQSFQYSDDKVNDTLYEYPRYPVEMLIDRKGDCEDKAILAATLLHLIGYSTCLLRLPNHMAVGVKYNKTLSLVDEYIDGYYFLETTRYNWEIGQVPSEYRGISNITVYPITSRPILIHRWINATRYTFQNKKDFVQIRLLVDNIGNANASFQVTGGFFSDSITYNKKEISIDQLQPDEKRLCVLRIQVPHRVSTILRTYILYEDVIVDQHESSSVFN